jgi:hypothetical protein
VSEQQSFVLRLALNLKMTRDISRSMIPEVDHGGACNLIEIFLLCYSMHAALPTKELNIGKLELVDLIVLFGSVDKLQYDARICKDVFVTL